MNQSIVTRDSRQVAVSVEFILTRHQITRVELKVVETKWWAW